MATWPLKSGPSLILNASRTTSSWTGVTVTASATQHTKGAWSELIASASGEATMLILYVSGTSTSTAATSTLLDIGIGAASSETVIISDLAIGYAIDRANNVRLYSIPLLIPAGSRVAARIQSQVVSKTAVLGADLIGGGPFESNGVPHAVDTYGANTAQSAGVSVAANATANVFGAWTQITASTARQHSGLFVGVQMAGSTSTFNRDYLAEVGIGGSGSEQPITRSLCLTSSSNEEIKAFGQPFVWPMGLDIPAGSRLSMRITATANTTLDFTLHGLVR